MDRFKYKSIEGAFKGVNVKVNIFENKVDVFYWKNNDLTTIEKLILKL